MAKAKKQVKAAKVKTKKPVKKAAKRGRLAKKKK